MDTPAEILDELKCSSCEVYLSRGPVYLQHDGGTVCCQCYTPQRPATQITKYEAMVKFMKFPCKNWKLGCNEMVPYVREGGVIAHDEVCEHRKYACLALGSACDWLGTKAAISAHFQDQHPDFVLKNPCTLTHDITMNSVHNYIISAFEKLFLLHTKVCMDTGKIFHAVRLLGESNDGLNYHFTLDIKRKDMLLSKPGSVAPQHNLVIQEDTALALDTNSLVSVLDGYNGTIFIVTVRQKTSDLDEQQTKTLEMCQKCGAEVTVFLYSNSKGWLCEKCCIPSIKGCEKMGCGYTDVSRKFSKHQTYFCKQSTRCGVCKRTVLPGLLTLHHSSECNRYGAGSTWQASHIYPRAIYCLIDSVVGPAVCRYWFSDHHFVLYVDMPVPVQQLREFRCVVHVINPTIGQAHVLMPDLDYMTTHDWKIEIKKDESPLWNVIYDVCVYITKI